MDPTPTVSKLSLIRMTTYIFGYSAFKAGKLERSPHQMTSTRLLDVFSMLDDDLKNKPLKSRAYGFVWKDGRWGFGDNTVLCKISSPVDIPP